MKELILNWLGTLTYGWFFQNSYIFALLILLFFALAAKILLFIFNQYLRAFAKKTKTKVDDIIFENTKNPSFILCWLMA